LTLVAGTEGCRNITNGEVVDRIVRQMADEFRARGERREREQQRVAVALRLGDEIGADDPGAGRLVLYDEALAEAQAELLREDAPDDVGAAAGGEGNDDAHRVRGIVFRESERSRQRKRSNRHGEPGAHRSSSVSAV
jgi:hypothetical protein